MSLIYCDSFMLYQTANQRFDLATGLFSIANTAGRNRRGVLGFFDSGVAVKKFPGANTYTQAIAMQTTTPPVNQGGDVFRFFIDSATLTTCASVGLASSGRLFARAGGTTVYSNPLPAMRQNSWCFIEAVCAVSWLAGVLSVTVEVFFNSSASPVCLASSTIATGFQNMTALGIAWQNGGQFVNYCDWRVCTGDILGDTATLGAVPNGTGIRAQWAPHPNTSANWQIVSAIPINTSNFVSGTAVGQSDLYQFPALTVPVGGTIFGVQECLFIVGTDVVGTDTVNFLINKSGTDFLMTPQNTPTGSAAYLFEMFLTDPSNGSPWALNAIGGGITQFGQEVVSL